MIEVRNCISNVNSYLTLMFTSSFIKFMAGIVVVIFAMSIPDNAHAIFAAPGHCGTNCLIYRHAVPGNIFQQILITTIMFFGISFYLGHFVEKHNWVVGYTRKILALSIYVTPFALDYFFTYRMNAVSVIMTAATTVVCILLMSHPFRSRCKFLATAFAAIDRPNDKPLTLTWLSTSIVASWCVVIVWYVLIGPDSWPYIFIALFISGVGDALAEPVGIKYGRNKYNVRAIWTDKIYTRSIEGSICVFLSGVVAVVIAGQIYLSFANSQQFLWSLMLIPVITTIAEAKSPHTWDQPFIIGSCGVISAIILQLSQTLVSVPAVSILAQ